MFIYFLDILIYNMTKAKEPVTKDMLIGDIVKKHPFSIDIMLEHGMQCVGCHVATWETLEQAAAGHGVDVGKLVKELNEVIK